MKAEEIAQWVLDNRYPKGENNKISDHEMYHFIVDNVKQAFFLSDVIKSVCPKCACEDIITTIYCNRCHEAM